jgi:hypothetical protein
MHPGVISCLPETPLRAVARMMASYRVHAIIVMPRHMGDLAHSLSWGVVSDLDLIRGAQEGDVDSDTARTVAGTPVRSIELTAPLAGAVDAMIAEGLSHRRTCARRAQPRRRNRGADLSVTPTLACAQCGRPLPDDPGELARWKQGALAAAELDEVAAAMLLCPECVEDDRAGEYEEGEAG